MAKTKILEPVKTMCDDCPFRKDSRQQAFACVALMDFVDYRKQSDFWQHTCHKTDPRAAGYKEGYTGEKRQCVGSMASAKKSRVRNCIRIEVPRGTMAKVWSFPELGKVYKSALRRIKRWERKRDRIMAHHGLHYDAHDMYISDGAIYAGLDEKDKFFNFINTFCKGGKKHDAG